jgi:hypothetical protein
MTRASIRKELLSFKLMDCRLMDCQVKPGNDEWMLLTHSALLTSLIRGSAASIRLR